VVNSAEVAEISARVGRPPVSVFYRALMQLGLVVLDGTKDAAHMRDDVDALSFVLDSRDVAVVDGLLR